MGRGYRGLRVFELLEDREGRVFQFRLPVVDG